MIFIAWKSGYLLAGNPIAAAENILFSFLAMGILVLILTFSSYYSIITWAGVQARRCRKTREKLFSTFPLTRAQLSGALLTVSLGVKTEKRWRHVNSAHRAKKAKTANLMTSQLILVEVSKHVRERVERAASQAAVRFEEQSRNVERREGNQQRQESCWRKK